jgi:hypothetical protein
MHNSRPITIIPLGAPGAGKSNVNNKLIGQDRFESSSSAVSGVTRNISHHTCPAFGKPGN